MATNNAANQSTSGIQSLASTGVFNGRTITGTANQISVSNGDGISGNPTLSLTSTIQVSGISFDSGSHTLSAYATGTFTPTVTGSSSNPSVGYTSQTGVYEKIGLKVYINSSIVLSSFSGGSGNVQLDALPFTSLNSTNAVSCTALCLGSVTFGASVLYYQGEVSVNTTFAICPGVKSAAARLNLVVGGVSASSIFTYAAAYNI